jgi:hypothetical protein
MDETDRPAAIGRRYFFFVAGLTAVVFFVAGFSLFRW